MTISKWWPSAATVLVVGSLAAWVLPAARPGQAAGGAAPLVWPVCSSDQVEVLILGSAHFHQSDEMDILEPRRQKDLDAILTELARFAPERIAVEFPRTEQTELDGEYGTYRNRGVTGLSRLSPRNEIVQIGFALGARLGHGAIYAVDVPMNLWHDSIALFDERYPTSRDSLRSLWPLRHPPGPDREPVDGSLADRLRSLNTDLPPGNSEMYAGFLPLVEEELYAGALKLRPWYDRNLRIIQNLFRALDPADRRILLVIGAGHLRVLKQMLELTPQLCPVDPLLHLPAG